MSKVPFNIGILALCIAMQSPIAAVAQTYPTADQFSSVATLNQDRLFSNSQFGLSFNKKLQEDTNLLAEENRRIEKELEDEENNLTQKRKELSNVEFRKLAASFNEKVEAIRRDQTQKLNDLNTRRIQTQRNFFVQVKPIIIELMQERGIEFILNDQAIFMSAGAGDITESVIERIDRTIDVSNFETPQ